MPLVEPIDVIGEQAGKHAKRRLDLADVVGQVEAKWACEVAAAGRHHLLFHGRPASARPCWPNVSRVCFLILMSTTLWRSRRCTRLLASISPMSSSPGRPTATHITPHRLPALSVAVSG